MRLESMKDFILLARSTNSDLFMVPFFISSNGPVGSAADFRAIEVNTPLLACDVAAVSKYKNWGMLTCNDDIVTKLGSLWFSSMKTLTRPATSLICLSVNDGVAGVLLVL